MKKFSYLLVGAIIGILFVVSCSTGEKDNAGSFDVQLDIPEEINAGTDGLVKFRILFGKAPESTDIVVLRDSGGKDHDC